MEYKIDTTGGNSGGPLLDNSNFVLGINTREYVDIEYNFGSRVTQQMYDMVNSVINNN